jgi:hypothetical protein
MLSSAIDMIAVSAYLQGLQHSKHVAQTTCNDLLENIL